MQSHPVDAADSPADAIWEGFVAKNAAALARPLRLDDARESVILTPEQIQGLFRVAERHRDRPLWVVAICKGPGGREPGRT
jgi:hypothetical protein